MNVINPINPINPPSPVDFTSVTRGYCSCKHTSITFEHLVKTHLRLFKRGFNIIRYSAKCKIGVWFWHHRTLNYSNHDVSTSIYESILYLSIFYNHPYTLKKISIINIPILPIGILTIASKSWLPLVMCQCILSTIWLFWDWTRKRRKKTWWTLFCTQFPEFAILSLHFQNPCQIPN